MFFFESMEEDGSSISPSRSSTKKRRASNKLLIAKLRKRVRTSSDVDDMRNQESSSCSDSSGKEQVSTWTLQRAESYGLCYNAESSEISKFYDLCTTNKSVFKYPLEKDRKKILDSLVSQVDKLDRPGVTWKEGELWRTWSRFRGVLEKCEKTLQAIDEELNCPQKNSKLLLLSQSAMRRFYMYLREFLIQSDWDCANEKSIPKQSYRDLCYKFLEIFLLNVRSGSMDKSLMMIKGVRNTSVPDLCVTMPVATISSPGRSSSVAVIRVVEVEADFEDEDLNEGFHISRAVRPDILGWHAGELLLDLRKSFLADIGVIIGVLCMKTSLVFTCLKMSWKHYESIKKYGEDVARKGMLFDDDDDDDDDDDEEEEKEEEEKKKERQKNKELKQKISVRKCTGERSGTIFYTRPYNFLVKEDRSQIKDFLFWLGVQLETLECN